MNGGILEGFPILETVSYRIAMFFSSAFRAVDVVPVLDMQFVLLGLKLNQLALVVDQVPCREFIKATKKDGAMVDVTGHKAGQRPETSHVIIVRALLWCIKVHHVVYLAYPLPMPESRSSGQEKALPKIKNGLPLPY